MKQILELIENVDPSNTDALDEIDARVWCWLDDKEYAGQDKLGNQIYKEREGCFPMVGCGSFEAGNVKQYTRSRDALKAIRPEGWRICIEDFSSFKCTLMPYDSGFEPDPNNYEIIWDDPASKVGKGKTEELAELHAVIQVIEYERNQKQEAA